MAMSRKHYNEVAHILSLEVTTCEMMDNDYGQGGIDALRKVANSLADMFKSDNSRFDRERFLKAAGFDHSNDPVDINADEYCPFCEREVPFHYENCPTRRKGN